MTTSNPVPDPVREESQEPQPRTPYLNLTDPLPGPAGAPRKQERDYLVIGLIIALMAMIVAGFFALDGKIDALETAVNGRIDALNARMDALSTRMDGLYELVLSLKK
ncbi:MAG: hypothetical protein F4099_00565 [Synechococcus sp. SB0673_bin_10]|nr:hypothetical protein [Cyanobacteria bacterium MAG IRC3_bin_20]MDE0648290.1 hypothetical protein [Cyanobacteria bacterium MAG IRC4_bin_6]MXW12947.1 hypothetical protein [Synechococcus sp. SB0668_bin_13]MYG63911.1 hypothetical protein [Synechococcus sp. SB0675_bin_7]MYI71021.1 hypothetical protein [Synechococcus sp. SB0673_bin_10]MYK85697.1 hypothetical protein [Synechococcus sp. SB0669_bin_7]